jgi:ribosomal protein L40E
MAKGHKDCLECGAENAARSSKCSKCGYTFYQTKNPLIEKKESTGLGRGKKVCVKCGGVNGAKAHNCVKCGAGFIIKGKQLPDTSVTIVKDNVEVNVNTEKIRFSEIFKPIESTEHELKCYGKKHKAWISICGNYKINYGPLFYNIPVPNNKPFKLLCKHNTQWDLADRPYIFGKMGKAVKSYLQRISKDGSSEQIKRLHPKLEKAIDKMKKLSVKRK